MSNLFKPSFIKTVVFLSLGINAVAFYMLAAGKLEFSRIKPLPSANCNQVCKDYSDTRIYKPYPLIKGSELMKIAYNYRFPNSGSVPNVDWRTGTTTSQWKVDNANTNSTDAYSAWFSLDDLKYFLWTIETKVCQNSCMKLTSDKLGVRIYYGRYVKNSELLTSNSQLAGFHNLHTVFMIPTFDSLNNGMINHYDFALDSTLMTKSCTPIALPPVEVTIDDESGKITWEFRSNIQLGTYLLPLPDGKNHGNLCPPLTNCAGAAFDK